MDYASYIILQGQYELGNAEYVDTHMFIRFVV